MPKTYNLNGFSRIGTPCDCSKLQFTTALQCKKHDKGSNSTALLSLSARTTGKKFPVPQEACPTGSSSPLGMKNFERQLSRCSAVIGRLRLDVCKGSQFKDCRPDGHPWPWPWPSIDPCKLLNNCLTCVVAHAHKSSMHPIWHEEFQFRHARANLRMHMLLRDYPRLHMKVAIHREFYNSVASLQRALSRLMSDHPLGFSYI
eukprot:1151958-Pelagomonas_calceolata.AAC.3